LHHQADIAALCRNPSEANMLALNTSEALILTLLSSGVKIAVVIWIIHKLNRIARNSVILEKRLEVIQEHLKKLQ
jgi:hypothetical protein